MQAEFHKVTDVQLRLLYSPERIAAEIERLAGQITADYAGEELVMLVVLKGAFVFAADLVRLVRAPVLVEFIRLTSYNGTDTTGRVVITMDVAGELAGKSVLVVEDIVDTGLTQAFLVENLRQRGVKSLRVCTLINKTERRRVGITPDYVGIECDGGFLVGYGLDLDERYRELAAIYELQ